MLKTTSKVGLAQRAAANIDVEIASIARAVPTHKVSQAEMSQHAKALFPDLARLEGLYANTGIETRYACEPLDWYYRRHGWETRTVVFQRHALALLEEVALKAVEAAGIRLADIGALVVNTITGLAIPSLDAKLMNRINLPPSVERLPNRARTWRIPGRCFATSATCRRPRLCLPSPRRWKLALGARTY